MARTAKSMGLTENSDLIKNIAVHGSLSRDVIAELYSSVGHLMAEEHRQYIERMLDGGSEVDALLDLEMMLRLVTIYSMQAVRWSVERGTVSKDIGSILGEARQTAVAVENMRVKRNEAANKVQAEDDVIDPTSVKMFDRFSQRTDGE